MKALFRALDILEALAQADHGLTVQQLAARTRMPRSTVYRFLGILARKGLIQGEAGGRTYRLGLVLFRWGAAVSGRIEVRRLAIPVMEELAAKSGESAFLSVREGLTSLCIESRESVSPLRYTPRLGMALPLHAGAASRILLADEVLHRRIHLPQLRLDRLTPFTLTGRAELGRRLDEIRARGYETSEEEIFEGTMGIAAPIFDYRGEVVAALSIGGVKDRMTRSGLSGLVELVVWGAADISRTLVGRPSASSWGLE